MAAPVTPAKRLANGKDTWWLVPAGANPAAPTVANVNSVTGLNISGVLLQDYEGLTVSTDRVTLPAVMLETVITEIAGNTTVTAADMQITFDPQAASGADGKKAWTLLNGGGWDGWAVRRQDSPAGNGDVTAGQFVDVAVVEIGQPIPGKTTSGADGIYIITAPVSPVQVVWNKAVAA
jgi:hypothetical protein